MCKVKVSGVTDGLIASEKVVQLDTKSGSEEVWVSADQVSEGAMDAAFIGADDKGNVLIELPREAMSGHRRVWIDKAQLVRS